MSHRKSMIELHNQVIEEVVSNYSQEQRESLAIELANVGILTSQHHRIPGDSLHVSLESGGPLARFYDRFCELCRSEGHAEIDIAYHFAGFAKERAVMGLTQRIEYLEQKLIEKIEIVIPT